MLTIYHNTRCSKSRQALDLLQQENREVQVIEYLKTPPTAAELQSLAQKLHLKPEDLVRKQEKLFKEKFAGKVYTDEEWVAILVANPSLIERPIVVKGDKAVIGRPPENVLALL
ncbi:arsenate reductase (glutaredoxin) [Pontibacter qinzhouensis]|uniref:Arsenate reductase (Glutaredoxin) n=1 Tax=Pontibacter qinzhouensis TaxID=2603253 RepID=A0A5C8KAZ0_9BACT|nr:arsenate reductase (glutaredoxin) [Pontibacter qinzhouensis]TXK49835.1 arsenate reductase (glutaredoxin) [Pontibacter qinzhouensis]